MPPVRIRAAAKQDRLAPEEPRKPEQADAPAGERGSARRADNRRTGPELDGNRRKGRRRCMREQHRVGQPAPDHFETSAERVEQIQASTEDGAVSAERWRPKPFGIDDLVEKQPTETARRATQAALNAAQGTASNAWCPVALHRGRSAPEGCGSGVLIKHEDRWGVLKWATAEPLKGLLIEIGAPADRRREHRDSSKRAGRTERSSFTAAAEEARSSTSRSA